MIKGSYTGLVPIKMKQSKWQLKIAGQHDKIEVMRIGSTLTTESCEHETYIEAVGFQRYIKT